MSEANNTVEPTSSEAAEHLKSYIERLEFVQAEIAERREDASGIFAEAKGNGFDVKALRKILVLRKKDAAERQEEEAIEKLYREALGLV